MSYRRRCWSDRLRWSPSRRRWGPRRSDVQYSTAAAFPVTRKTYSARYSIVPLSRKKENQYFVCTWFWQIQLRQRKIWHLPEKTRESISVTTAHFTWLMLLLYLAKWNFAEIRYTPQCKNKEIEMHNCSYRQQTSNHYWLVTQRWSL